MNIACQIRVPKQKEVRKEEVQKGPRAMLESLVKLLSANVKDKTPNGGGAGVGGTKLRSYVVNNSLN